MRTHVLHNWISAFTPKKETFKGEVCIDDLFRYLSALLASVDLWGYWFKYDDSAVVWFLYGVPCDQKLLLLLEGTQERPMTIPWGVEMEKWQSSLVSNYWPIWPSPSITFYRSSRTWQNLDLTLPSQSMVENKKANRCMKAAAVVQFNFSALCWHGINGLQTFWRILWDEYELGSSSCHLLFILKVNLAKKQVMIFGQIFFSASSKLKCTGGKIELY